MKLIFFSTLSLCLILSTACRKKKDTIANIIVEDNNSNRESGVEVVLYGTNTTGLPQTVAVMDTAYTNGEGIATFEFNDIYQLGQAGVAVLDIKATKGDLDGQGIIKIEAEQTNEEKVIIN